MYGNMTRIAVEPARAAKESPSFAGTGMSMECIERNGVMFEMLADTVWTTKPLDISAWLAKYLKARYHMNDPDIMWSHLLPAWLYLNSSVFHFNGQLVKALLEERPTLPADRMWKPPSYLPERVPAALELLLDAPANGLVIQGPFRQDVVDITRQMLVDVFSDLVVLCKSSAAIREIKGGDRHGLSEIMAKMLELFDDLVSLCVFLIIRN